MFLFYWALQDPKLGRIKTNFRPLGVEGELILLMGVIWRREMYILNNRWKGASPKQSNIAKVATMTI